MISERMINSRSLMHQTLRESTPHSHSRHHTANTTRQSNIMSSDFTADGPALSDRETRVLDMLRVAELRPTRQRVVLATLLFGGPDRHVSAEVLHAEALASGEHVSLATVYNTLHQFRGAGLVRELAIDASRAYFDTNTSNHNHFFIEEGGKLLDIPGDGIKVDGLPKPPAGMRISHIDVVVRLVPDDRS